METFVKFIQYMRDNKILYEWAKETAKRKRFFVSSNYLNSCFVWEDSPQGIEFWSNHDKAIYALCGEDYYRDPPENVKLSAVMYYAYCNKKLKAFSDDVLSGMELSELEVKYQNAEHNA